MIHSTKTLHRRILRHIACSLAIMFAGITTLSSAATIRQGDQVKLTRDEVLNFLGKPFRSGKVNESFVVLAYRPETKTVFVSGTDQDGKQIALSVAEEALAVVPRDPRKTRIDAIEAANAGRFADALRLINDAVQSGSTDGALQSTRTAIVQVQAAAQLLAKAMDEEKRSAADGARKRKNAAITDRPNPLRPGDKSNHDRAEQMRSDADRAEKQSAAAVTDAQAGLANAKASLVKLAGKDVDVGSTTAETGNQRLVEAATENRVGSSISALSPSGNANHEVTDARAKKEMEQWLSQRFNSDAFKDPFSTAANGGETPSYTETLEFVNGKLKPSMALGYGAEAGKMIYRFNYNNGPGFTAVFDPGDLNANVRYETFLRQGLGVVARRGSITLEVRNGEDKIVLYRPVLQPDGSLKVTEKTVSKVTIGNPVTFDALDTERLAKALRHLIEMFGGTAESF